MIRTKFTDLNFQNPYAKDCLTYGGGKAGLLQYAKEKPPKIKEHIPDGVFINSADASDPAKLENFLKNIDSSNSPKIVRGCTSFVQEVSLPEQEAINDFCGVVDVLKIEELYEEQRRNRFEIADYIIRESQTEEVTSHLQWEFDTKFDGNLLL